MKKYFAILVILLIVAGAMMGCSSNVQSSEDQVDDVSTTSEEEEKRDTVVISMVGDIANLDPQGHEDIYSILVDAQIFDSLIYADENGEYQMRLAESIEYSDDAIRATIKIKEGIKFTNGDELKASDVKFSFERAINSATFVAAGAIESVNVIDDYTVELIYIAPTAFKEYSIATCFIVNEKEVTAVGEDFGNGVEGVIGTGAYKINSWEKGQGLTFTRNDDYWDGQPAIKNINLKIIPDQSTAALALEKGEIDYIFDGDPLLEKTLANSSNVETTFGPTNAMTFITLNCGAPPFDNVDLRKAIAYAINRDDIITVAKEGNAKSTSHFVFDSMPGHASDVFSPEQDLEKAKEYLEKAGYKDGLTVTYISDDDTSARAGAVIQNVLSEIGITVEIQAMEFGAYAEKLMNGDYEMGLLGFFNMDNASFYEQIFHSEAGLTFAHYLTPELDALFENGKKEMDEEKRNDIYKGVQEIFRDDQVFIPLFVITQYMYADEDLGGVKVYPIMLPPFKDLYWK